ncbi:MAG: Hsp70 family protein [Caldilineaceae bacterium]|nr:Hsp70 family protein [Caldilineaceae bacterium]
MDFGTTHTSAAFYDGDQLHAIPLDPANANPNLLRSMIYITKEQACFLGAQAVHNYLEQDTGRPVIYAEKFVGTIEYTVAQQGRSPLEPDGPITIIQDVTMEDDIGIRGRLLQSIKTGLRADSYQGTDIFGRYYTLPELIARLLCHVRTQAEAHLSQPVQQVTLGRPVQFAEEPAADHRAEERLRQAAELAGFTTIDFVPEPVAAAAFYLNQVTAPETVLVFDFGGGTLDLTVMRADVGRVHEILATHGVLVGGDDLDSSLMRHHVAQHFGAGAPIDRNFDGRPILLPEDLADELRQWQTIPNLSRPKALAVIKRAKRYSPEAEKFLALETLVTRNYGFALFERIEQTKRALSDAMQAPLTMQAEAIDLALTLTRRDFNLAINAELSDARAGVRQVLAAAGVAATAIDAVVTTGGSSVIPSFQKMLTTELPAARLVPLDTFGGVTNGLAMAAYR